MPARPPFLRSPPALSLELKVRGLPHPHTHSCLSARPRGLLKTYEVLLMPHPKISSIEKQKRMGHAPRQVCCGPGPLGQDRRPWLRGSCSVTTPNSPFTQTVVSRRSQAQTPLHKTRSLKSDFPSPKPRPAFATGSNAGTEHQGADGSCPCITSEGTPSPRIGSSRQIKGTNHDHLEAAAATGWTADPAGPRPGSGRPLDQVPGRAPRGWGAATHCYRPIKYFPHASGGGEAPHPHRRPTRGVPAR